MQINTEEARELLVDCLKSDLVPFLTGSPGCGKSAIVHSIAKEYGLKVIDVRLSQCDPTEINGFPRIDQNTNKAIYTPMDIFPLETDSIPAGYNGFLLFLDEFNSAPVAVQAAAYKLVLDKHVGQHPLHSNCVIMCAGNLDTDNAITNRMSTAMQSRLVHLELAVDAKQWIDWANTAAIDYRVKAYINFKPDQLYHFDPDHNDKTFPCSRTWEFVSKLISKWKDIPYAKLPLIAGTISEGVAREFVQFCNIFQDLPTIQDIVRNPKNIPMSEEPSILYALSGAVGNYTNKGNLTPIMEYVSRMPVEFQVITVRDIISRNTDLMGEPALKGWINHNAKELM